MTIIVAISIIVLGVVDIWITGKVLNAGGKEANPLMRFLQDRLPFAWEFVKVAVHVAVAISVLQFEFMLWGGQLFVVVYLWVCYHNLRVLKKME